MLMVWLVCSVIASAAYLGYAIYFWGILNDPSILGDLVSGMAAFISLPSIFLVLKERRDDEIKERKKELQEKQDKDEQRRREDVAQMFRAVESVYAFPEHLSKYGFTLLHLLESIAVQKEANISKPAILWEDWHNQSDVFGYLRTCYFKPREKEVKAYIKGEIEKMQASKRTLSGPGLWYALDRISDGYNFYEKLLEELKGSYCNLSPNILKGLEEVVKNEAIKDIVNDANELLGR